MSEDIGQLLRQAREARSLTLEEAAYNTRIRAHYLRAIEAGDYRSLPSQAQGRGFLRTYAAFLGIDPLPLLAELDAGTRPAPPPSVVTTAAPPATPQVASEEANAIFRDIGESLRKQREILGLALEDVERNTHLRMHYLKSLEAGDLDSLPSPVQGRGMLHNYAEFLGMDADALLLRFAEGLQVKLAARQATRPSPRVAKARQQQKKRPSLRRIFSVDFIIGGAIVGLLTGFIVWGVIRISDIRSLAAQLTSTPTAPSIAEVLFSTPSLTQPLLTGTLAESQTPGTPGEALPSETPQEIAGTPGEPSDATAEVTLPPIENAAIQVQVVVRQRAWMRVMVDGQILFQGRVVPGSAHSFAGDDRVELLTGNGAALQVYYNQTDLGVLGGMGEVVFLVFTIQGVQTPTPTITPSPRPVTPSPSPRVTATPQP